MERHASDGSVLPFPGPIQNSPCYSSVRSRVVQPPRRLFDNDDLRTPFRQVAVFENGQRVNLEAGHNERFAGARSDELVRMSDGRIIGWSAQDGRVP
jgi:hypothetical protein